MAGGVVGVAPVGRVVGGYAGVVGDAFVDKWELALRWLSQAAPRGEAGWGRCRVYHDYSTSSLDTGCLESQEQWQHQHAASRTDKQELITPI